MPSPEPKNERIKLSMEQTDASSNAFSLTVKPAEPEEEKKKKPSLAAMFEQNLKSEDDERKVVLTKSEEELSSPDRRSLI